MCELARPRGSSRRTQESRSQEGAGPEVEAARGTRRSSTRDHRYVVAEALREARAAKVALAAMRAVLVGELHRDAAAQRMPDERDGRDVERVEEVAQPHREAGQRIFGTRFVRCPVAEEVRRYHPE